MNPKFASPDQGQDKKHSEETRRKISGTLKGQVPWNKDKPSPLKGRPSPLKGKKLSPEHRRKISASKRRRAIKDAFVHRKDMLVTLASNMRAQQDPEIFISRQKYKEKR